MGREGGVVQDWSDLVELPLDGRLGLALRAWRRFRRVKQDRLGGLLGVAQTTVSRWEAGTQVPDAGRRVRLRNLIGARLDTAADVELARLVRSSPDPVHLVCDVTRALLVASGTREREFGVSRADLVGRSLWHRAGPGIAEAESRLRNLGWYEPAARAVVLRTGANSSREMPIADTLCRWTRIQLSGGSFARLVRTYEDREEGSDAT